VSSLDCEKEIRSVHHDGGITAMACSPHGQFLLTGGGDQTIKVCSLLRVRMGSRVRMCECARACACMLARRVCVPCKCVGILCLCMRVCEGVFVGVCEYASVWSWCFCALHAWDALPMAVVQVWDMDMTGPPPPLFQAFVGHLGPVSALAFAPYVPCGRSCLISV
jgi:hypothetical protein